MISYKLYYPKNSEEWPTDLKINFIIKPEQTVGNIFRERFFKVYKGVISEGYNCDNIDKILECIYVHHYLMDNPLLNKKYQRRIKKHKSHTSINVGDIIEIDNTFYVTCSVGFAKILI